MLKKFGLQIKKERPEISLKRFMKCNTCNQPMRGYIAKDWDMPYYKCNTKGCKCNRNANVVNLQFEALLASHKIDTEYSTLIKEQLKLTFQEYNASLEENKDLIKRQLTDLSAKIDRLEERYILEEITGELYYKYKAKFEKEIDEISKNMKENSIELSKLDDYINFSLNFCSNLSEMWASGDYIQRQELQNSFFEQGITYDRKNDACRSIEINEFLIEISDLSKSFSKFTSDQLKNFKLSSTEAH